MNLKLIVYKNAAELSECLLSVPGVSRPSRLSKASYSRDIYLLEWW